MVDTISAALARAEAAAERLRAAGYRHKSTRNAGDPPPAPWFKIQNKADDATVAQVDIYDEIDWLWGVTSRDFRNQIQALPDTVTTIDLHINSPGGDVYEALAIMNTLRQHDAQVITTVDGYAASSAGFIAVGASDELIVAENAEIMAHLPWAIMIGDAADMRKMADDLDRIGRNIASIFMGRAGGTEDEWMAILTDETWWSAQEAVGAGIADKVLAAPKRDNGADAKNRFDLSVFNHAGRSNAPAPRTPVAHNQTPAPAEEQAEKGKEPTMGSLSESALQKLGLEADADDDAINAAIEGLPEPSEAQPVAAAAATPEGVVQLDQAQYDDLVAAAADGRAARAQQVAEDDERVVAAAVNDGRIPPARKQHWMDYLQRDREGGNQVLASLQPGLVPLTAAGHGIANEDTAIDAELNSISARITRVPVGKDA